jgi:hypothetical protein
MDASEPAHASEELTDACRTTSPMGSLQIAPNFTDQIYSPAYPYKGIKWSLCVLRRGGRIRAGVSLKIPSCIRSVVVRCAFSSIECDRPTEPEIGWIDERTLTPADTDVVRWSSRYYFTPDQARRCSCGRFHVDLRVISVTKEQDADAMLTDIWDKECNNNDILRGELKEAHEAMAGEKRKAEALKEENQVLQAKIKSLEEQVAAKAAVIDLSKDDDKEDDEPKAKKQKTEDPMSVKAFGDRYVELRRQEDRLWDELRLSRMVQSMTSAEMLALDNEVRKRVQDDEKPKSGWVEFRGLMFEKKDKEKEEKAKAEALQCRVCLNKPRCMLILPCNHLAICEDCADKVKAAAGPQCPMCRGPIDKTQKVYVS